MVLLFCFCFCFFVLFCFVLFCFVFCFVLWVLLKTDGRVKKTRAFFWCVGFPPSLQISQTEENCPFLQQKSRRWGVLRRSLGGGGERESKQKKCALHRRKIVLSFMKGLVHSFLK